MKKAARESRSKKTSPLDTKVYAYGVSRGKTGNGPLFTPEHDRVIMDQLRLANRYRNRLVEIERLRREEFRALRLSLSPALQAMEGEHARLESEVAALRTALGSVPTAAREASPQAEAVRALVLELRKKGHEVASERRRVQEEAFSVHDAAYAALREQILLETSKSPLAADRSEAGKAARRKAARMCSPHAKKDANAAAREAMLGDPAVPGPWKEKERISERAYTAAKAARRESGCFSGVCGSVEAATADSFRDSTVDPRTKRFDGTGTLSVQLATDRGLLVPDAMAGKPGPLLLLPREARLRKPRPGSRALTAVIRLSGRPVVSVDVPFVMHRPLPEDGVIKHVSLCVSRVGLRPVYEVQFVLESGWPDRLARRAQTGHIAVNHGWRTLPNGDVRVATTWDGTRHSHVVFPAKMFSSLRFADSLISASDVHFDTVRGRLREYIASSVLSDEMAAATEHVHLWRAHSKLARVARIMEREHLSAVPHGDILGDWRRERLSPSPKKDLFCPPDEFSAWLSARGVSDPGVSVALYLRLWQAKDAHLVNWARSVQRRVHLWQREVFRVSASRWSSKYGDVVVEKWDKSETAESPDPESDFRSHQEKAAGRVRQMSGVSKLTQALSDSFGKSSLHRESSVHITVSHFGCASPVSKSSLRAASVAKVALPDIDIRCPGCGVLYDQDVNAARNLWERRRERSGPAAPGDGGEASSAA